MPAHQPEIYTFSTLTELYLEFAGQIKDTADSSKSVSFALSGGETPSEFFDFILNEGLAHDIAWSRYQIYWGDERCVPPDHAESNYGMAFNHLLSQIEIPEENIHRMRGENDPEREAQRYGELIKSRIMESFNDIPRLDWLLMGVGEDGHTASLFPGQSADGLCIAAQHPLSGQYRISMNYDLINTAKRISFIVTGRNKAEIMSSILSGESGEMDLPAARIQPVAGRLEWYLDGEAAALL